MRMHPILEELAAVVAASLMRHPGLTPEAAARAAEAIVDALRETYGGCRQLYIPSSKYTTEWMREQIRSRWNGTNTRALCRELEITDSWLRKLAAGQK